MCIVLVATTPFFFFPFSWVSGFKSHSYILLLHRFCTVFGTPFLDPHQHNHNHNHNQNPTGSQAKQKVTSKQPQSTFLPFAHISVVHAIVYCCHLLVVLFLLLLYWWLYIYVVKCLYACSVVPTITIIIIIIIIIITLIVYCLDDCVSVSVSCNLSWLSCWLSIHLSTNLCLYQCMLISIRACMCTILMGCQHINIYMDTWMYASLGLLDHHIFVILDSPALLSKLCATQGRKESWVELIGFVHVIWRGWTSRKEEREEGSSRDCLLAWLGKGGKEGRKGRRWLPTYLVLLVLIFVFFCVCCGHLPQHMLAFHHWAGCGAGTAVVHRFAFCFCFCFVIDSSILCFLFFVFSW